MLHCIKAIVIKVKVPNLLLVISKRTRIPIRPTTSDAVNLLCFLF